MYKKAVTSLSAVVMVIVTLALIFAALFSFLTYGNAKVQISPKILDSVYILENKAKFLRSQGASLQEAADSIGGTVSGQNKITINGNVKYPNQEMGYSYEFSLEEPNWRELLTKQGMSMEDINKLTSQGKSLEDAYRQIVKG